MSFFTSAHPVRHLDRLIGDRDTPLAKLLRRPLDGERCTLRAGETGANVVGEMTQRLVRLRRLQLTSDDRVRRRLSERRNRKEQRQNPNKHLHKPRSVVPGTAAVPAALN